MLESGYVGRGTDDDRFHLRLKVRSLSEGFEDEQWIMAIAGPALVELTRQISWPCDVATLDGLSMMIHETTHRIAPLSIDRNMVGQTMPILGSASGLAYIAFAPKQEQQNLLALLARRIRTTRSRAMRRRCRASFSPPGVAATACGRGAKSGLTPAPSPCQSGSGIASWAALTRSGWRA